MIIDCSGLFEQLQQESKADRELYEYCQNNYGIDLRKPLPYLPEIIIYGEAYAFLPERE